MRRVEQSHVIIKSMQTSTGSLMRQQAKKTAYITLTDHNTLWGGEMTDYSDLVKRLREHAENMYVDFLNEAADAIEVLERDAVLVTDAMVALTDRVQELKAALKPFEEELKNQELEVPQVIDGDSLIHNYGLRLRDLRSVRAALEKKND